MNEAIIIILCVVTVISYYIGKKHKTTRIIKSVMYDLRFNIGYNYYSYYRMNFQKDIIKYLSAKYDIDIKEVGNEYILEEWKEELLKINEKN